MMHGREAFQPTARCSDAEFARSLARIWPHRLHESNWLKNVFCYFGWHSWRQLYLDGLLPARREVRFCFWCDKVKVDGTVHGD